MLRLGKDRSISDYLERVKDRRELISRKFGSDGHEVKVEHIRSSMRYREFEMTKLRYQHNVASSLRKDDKESRQPSSGRADFSSLRYHREKRISSHHQPSSSPSRDLPPSTDQIRDRVVGLRNVGHSSSLSELIDELPVSHLTRRPQVCSFQPEIQNGRAETRDSCRRQLRCVMMMMLLLQAVHGEQAHALRSKRS